MSLLLPLPLLPLLLLLLLLLRLLRLLLLLLLLLAPATRASRVAVHRQPQLRQGLPPEPHRLDDGVEVRARVPAVRGAHALGAAPRDHARHVDVRAALALRLTRGRQRQRAVQLARLVARRPHHARRARQHFLFKDGQRGVDSFRDTERTDVVGEAPRQEHGVRHSLIRALRLERRHRVRGVPDERDAPGV